MLDDDGTYVLVCTGINMPDALERQAVGHLKSFFAKCGYKRAKVEIWSQNKLIGVLEQLRSAAAGRRSVLSDHATLLVDLADS